MIISEKETKHFIDFIIVFFALFSFKHSTARHHINNAIIKSAVSNTDSAGGAVKDVYKEDTCEHE